MTDAPRIPELPEHLQAMCERTRAVALRLVGLNLHDANVLASRSGCHLRLVQRDGKGIPVTADFHARRISIETEGDIVVGTSIG